MRELAERIAMHVYESPADEEVRDIRLALYHTHLPRLEDADVVSYDRDERTVAPRPNFDDLVGFLDTVTERDVTWTST